MHFKMFLALRIKYRNQNKWK